MGGTLKQGFQCERKTLRSCIVLQVGRLPMKRMSGVAFRVLDVSHHILEPLVWSLGPFEIEEALCLYGTLIVPKGYEVWGPQ